MKITSVANLSMSFDDPLFSGITFDIEHNDRIGLVGANGIGKTTLFKIMLNQLKQTSGDVFVGKHISIGYMEQHLSISPNKTVYEEALHVFAHLDQISLELDQIHHDIDHNLGNLESLVTRQHVLHERFEQQGGLTYQSRTRAMLLGLGFTQADLLKTAANLSGGEKTKVSLSKMLLSGANLLLLDEPTNHLDIPSVEWLEGFLSTYNGAFVVISHDRRFLNGVCSRIFDMVHGKLKTYDGNYTAYLKQKKLDEEQVARDNKNVQREINRVNSIIEQQLRWNRERNIKTARSKQHVVDKLTEQLVATDKESRRMHLSFNTDALGGKEVLDATVISKAFGAQQLFKDASFKIRRGERVFLLGGNGSGKTTLFKIIQGSVSQDAGLIKIGINIVPAYFDQTQSNLTEEKTVLETVHHAYPNLTETQVRTMLGAFLFVKGDVFKVVKDLSGGERAKLSLLLLMLSKANFLLLDEPTNHLDIYSKEALQHALNDYPGTMLIISHDRYLINEMADRILYLDDDGLTEYLGNYDYYLAKRDGKPLPLPTLIEKPIVNDYKQRKELQSKINKLKGKIIRLEDEIMADEAVISKLEHKMADPEIVNDYNLVMDINEQAEVLKDAIASKYDRLHELEMDLENTQA